MKVKKEAVLELSRTASFYVLFEILLLFSDSSFISHKPKI